MSSSSLMQRMRRYVFCMPLMLTCHEVEEFLSNYYEGKLTKLERAKFDFNIILCLEQVPFLAFLCLMCPGMENLRGRSQTVSISSCGSISIL
jgi:hypothetical protein